MRITKDLANLVNIGQVHVPADRLVLNGSSGLTARGTSDSTSEIGNASNNLALTDTSGLLANFDIECGRPTFDTQAIALCPQIEDLGLKGCLATVIR